MRWELFIRVLVTGVFGLLGWEIGRVTLQIEQIDQLTWDAARVLGPAVLMAALVGFVVAPWITVKPAKAARTSLRGVPTMQILAGTVGLVIGLVIAALLAYPLSLLPTPFGTVLPFVGAIVLGYLGTMIMVLRQREIFSVFRLGPSEQGKQQEKPDQQMESIMLLDTSVIIDGRIADVAETGFLWAVLAVPRFVLNELQYIADSSEVLRRNRGRRGLEMLDRLRNCDAVEIDFLDQDPDDARLVDDKLISLARDLGAAIVTNDYNLNRVAKLQGVRVLNINELANAVKSVVLPGEELGIKVIQEGKEINQGVGYLEDGTMVVVENGRRFLSYEITVQVTKVLQTNAGRLIFAVPNGQTERSTSLSHTSSSETAEK